MQRPVPLDQIASIECKHAVYGRANDYSGDDLITVKEVITTTSGEVIPNMYFIKNFKKDFYITKEGYRSKDNEKKEWEDLSKLQKFTTTEAKLTESVAKALGKPGMKGGLRKLARSPYIYGADISTPTLIKKRYRDRYPDAASPNGVAVLDIETDVVNGHERPILVCISFKDKVVLTATKEYIGTIQNPIQKLRDKAHELLGDIIKARNITLDIKICDNAGEACAYAIAQAHIWQPDFLTVWNIDFDIPRIITCLEFFGYDPAQVFSDPSVPNRFKFFKYKQGRTQKVTASGAISSIHFADRWHIAECPASFYLIDSMCMYKRIRVAAMNEPSYSLDALLNKHLGMRKLKFTEADHLSGLEWHQFMQSEKKIEYGVYNIFDCIGVELFDEEVKDLSTSITVLSGISEYKIFDSQPKRLIDNLYFFCQEKGKVIACASDQMTADIDKHVTNMVGWVITLPTHLTVENGIPLIKELPNVRSMMRLHVADLDLSAAYPSTEYFLNISKETTYRELSRIKNVDELTVRMATINLSASHVNATEICRNIFKAPSFDELLHAFEEEECLVS